MMKKKGMWQYSAGVSKVKTTTQLPLKLLCSHFKRVRPDILVPSYEINNKMNGAGPRLDPWGTPQLITFDLHAFQRCTMRHGGFRTVWPTCTIPNGSAKRRWTPWWRWDPGTGCGRPFFLPRHLYYFLRSSDVFPFLLLFLVVTHFLCLNCLRF